jgi:hypothetical protein
MLGRPFSIEVSKRVDGLSKRFDVRETNVTSATWQASERANNLLW